MLLPQISPSPLTSVKEPIGHPNWVYECGIGGRLLLEYLL
jgi:hypothetical protein